MLAFQVGVDDQTAVTAGVKDWAVLSAIVTALGGEVARRDSKNYIRLTLRGACAPDSDGVSMHIRWESTPLKIGSRILIKVVDSETVNPPIKRYRSDSRVQEDPLAEDEAKYLLNDEPNVRPEADGILAFEVRIDDQPAVLAGVKEWSVMSAYLDAIGGEAARVESQHQLYLGLGGLCEPDENGESFHVRWDQRPLKIGSTVLIKVVLTHSPTPPVKRFISKPQGDDDALTRKEPEKT